MSFFPKNIITGLITFFLTISLTPDTSTAQVGLDIEDDSLTQTVLIHPVIETTEEELLFSREHTYGKRLGLGDQLARDFAVAQSTDDGILQFYKNKGKENQDYVSWRRDVLAPVSGIVAKVNHPENSNKPGLMNRQTDPGFIIIKNKEGVNIVLVHVREIEVALIFTC